MSYCRFIEADIYLFSSSCGGVECCLCGIGPYKFSTYQSAGGRRGLFSFLRILKKKRGNFLRFIKNPRKVAIQEKTVGRFERREPRLRTSAEALNHVMLHVERGDYVPAHVISRLKDEVLHNVPQVRFPIGIRDNGKIRNKLKPAKKIRGTGRYNRF